jgi:L-fuconolactonase
MTQAIDSHQHFWSVTSGRAMWPTREEGVIYRDYGPHDLQPHLQHNGISGTVLVQSDPSEPHTLELLALAREHEFVLGVVGWVDFDAGDAPARILQLAVDPMLVGLRPMIQNIADAQWMLQPHLAPSIETMVAHDLTFDALVKPQHLSALLEFCGRYPQLRIVIDHGAKPRIRDRDFADWARDMRLLANQANTWCKISGLVTEADLADPDVLKPYLEHLLQCFGPQRLLWGSDWPVCEAVCDYDAWYRMAHTLLNELSTAERDAIFGNVAREVYRLGPQQRTAAIFPRR